MSCQKRAAKTCLRPCFKITNKLKRHLRLPNICQAV
ncbi:Uncharacterised protein [Vibrio cholerae]|nr:Uncharacterised protein [Vibrio cholerae]